ncbi:MAG: hypothetical protein AB7F40_04580 [Victivallaceae bacterium]
MDSWIFREPEYLRAWLIVLMEVNVEPCDVVIGGVTVECGRGCKMYSLATWAEKFGKGWDRARVRRFFAQLERNEMIVLGTSNHPANHPANRATHLTVLNYDTYQNGNQTESPTTRPTTRPQYKNKEDKNINTSANSAFSFEEFWELYGKKVDRAKCEKLYAKVSEADRGMIKVTLPAYVASTPDVQFRKHPQTWLNGKCWNDEISASGTGFAVNKPIYGESERNNASDVF